MHKTHWTSIFATYVIFLPATLSSYLNPGQTCFFARSLNIGNTCSDTATSKWYFDFQRLTCLQFSFYGCNGNFNNFQTQEECLNACSAFKLPPRLMSRNDPANGAIVYNARKVPGETDEKEIHQRGQRIDLLCKHSKMTEDLEIEFCKWTRPPIPSESFDGTFTREGRSIIFKNDSIEPNNNPGYSYYGGGLAEGECGLTIESVADSDVGYWSCFLINRQSRDSDTIISYQGSFLVGPFENEESNDTLKKVGIGLAICVIAWIILVAIGLTIWGRKYDKLCFKKSEPVENRGKGEVPMRPEEVAPAVSPTSTSNKYNRSWL